MKNRVFKSSLTFAVILASLSPVLANTTDITIQGTLEDVMSLQIEKTTNSAVVSADNVDPSVSLASNEVLNFGNVNPLGIETTSSSAAAVNRAGAAGINGTSFTIKSMVIDTSNILHNPVESGSNLLPKNSTNKGALYFTEGAVQLRSLRTGGGDMVIDVFNEGDFDAVIGQTTLSFNATATMASNIAPASANFGPTGGGTPDLPSFVNLTNDVAKPLSLGIIVPYNMAFSSGGNNNKSSKITFKGL